MRNFYRERVFHVFKDDVSGTMQRDGKPVPYKKYLALILKHHLALMFLIISSTVSFS